MIVVIDPNVFRASLTDSGSKDMVSQIFDGLDELRIAVVKKGDIIRHTGTFSKTILK
jgi:hypothetical protein